MTTALIISIGLFVIGIVLCLIYTAFDLDDVYLFIGGGLMITSTILLVFLILIINITQVEKPTPLEYPASEYTLSYKVTEFEGQRDTTYVLIPKEK